MSPQGAGDSAGEDARAIPSAGPLGRPWGAPCGGAWMPATTTSSSAVSRAAERCARSTNPRPIAALTARRRGPSPSSPSPWLTWSMILTRALRSHSQYPRCYAGDDREIRARRYAQGLSSARNPAGSCQHIAARGERAASAETTPERKRRQAPPRSARPPARAIRTRPLSATVEPRTVVEPAAVSASWRPRDRGRDRLRHRGHRAPRYRDGRAGPSARQVARLTLIPLSLASGSGSHRRGLGRTRLKPAYARISRGRIPHA